MVDDTEEELKETERRMNAAIFRRLFDLAVAGDAPAEGLAKRVAEVQRRNVTIERNEMGRLIAHAGQASARDVPESMDAFARGVFSTSPEFAQEVKVWEEKKSRYVNGNRNSVNSVTLLPTKPQSDARLEEAQRQVAIHQSSIRGAF